MLPAPLPAHPCRAARDFEGRAGNRNAVAVARLTEAYEHAGLQVPRVLSRAAWPRR